MNKPSKKILTLIIANEFCERFCYYGFRALLFTFFKDVYAQNDKSATEFVHLFNFLCYIFTFAGGILSDNIIGRYFTILYLSIIYFVGTLFTTISALYLSQPLLFLGLFFISIGTGGIKPCVSTFGGDQFSIDDLDGIRSFFNMFYFAINAGSLISIFSSPIIASKPCFGKDTCYPIAFGVPAALLFASCFLFICGKKSYIKKVPDREFLLKMLNCIKIYIKNFSFTNFRRNNITKEKIINNHGDKFYSEIVQMLNILKVFGLIPIFWMLYDQQSSTWIEQGNTMTKSITTRFFSFEILPSQMQAINGSFILILIPIFVRVVYPTLEKHNINVNNLNRMSLGIFFISLSFFCAALVQHFISIRMHILWQIPQYILLTIGEVFLSMTGIQFVYSESPNSMKGIILSFWLMTVAIGNIYVVIFTSLDLAKWLNIRNDKFFNFILYGTVGMVSAFYFSRLSRNFKLK